MEANINQNQLKWKIHNQSTQLLVRQLRNSGVMHRIEPLSRKCKEMTSSYMIGIPRSSNNMNNNKYLKYLNHLLSTE